ncbi:hypothetical protein CHCC14427_0216 [Bacillus paralicheniformis]|nr:hypothetical protein CHCC14427_0216 [Bacillus paralicheniformis]
MLFYCRPAAAGASFSSYYCKKRDFLYGCAVRQKGQLFVGKSLSG